MSEAVSAAAAEPTRLVKHGHVAVLTLADPQRRNAFSIEMSTSLAARVRQACSDEDVRAIVVAAEPPVFCAGGSLDDLLRPRAPLAAVYAGFSALRSAPVPTIAAVAGPVIGAGMNIPLACDVVIAGRSAQFNSRFLDLGLHPGGGLLWQLERAVGRQAAAALVICGEKLSATDAVGRGLAYACVADCDVLPTALELANRAAQRPRDLLIRTKRTLSAGAALTTAGDAMALEQEAQEWSMAQPQFTQRVAAVREQLGARRRGDARGGSR